jgi:hypothetical protein
MDENQAIEGVWEREGDELAGCSIRVSARGAGWEGVLIYATSAAVRAGWEVGDRKWVEILGGNGGRFLGRDLLKVYDRTRREVLEARYMAKVFRVRGRRLTVRAPEWWKAFGGIQSWQRLG